MSLSHPGRCVLVTLALLAWSAAFAPHAAEAASPPVKIHPRLATKMAAAPGPVAAWVFLLDKEGARPAQPTARADARRAKTAYAAGEGDAPLSASYIAAIEKSGARIRTRSRWLNAVSVIADRAAIERIAELPFVTRIREVAALAAPPSPLAAEKPKRSSPRTDDYGLSDIQLAQIHATEILRDGYSGSGVHIILMDSGFYTGAPCFASMDVAMRRDFINGDTTVDGIGETHGAQTLSVIGGYDPGWIVGPARDAVFYLAQTENDTLEYPGEEDFWIAAIEWGESLGVDVASSSVGYVDWYDYEDMDGRTAPISIAAQAAVDRGMVVVNSAGNEAILPWHYIIAPADAPGVLAAAAVSINGDRVSFSSFGPTSDGRIKPDLAALGSGVAGVVNPRGGTPAAIYGEGLSGTSYSAPLIAGACALLLEIHPILTPELLAAALKATASQSDAPDTALGWGIVRAYEAALRPVVVHDPAGDVTWNGTDAYAVDLRLSLYPGFDEPRAVFGGADAFTDTVPLVSAGGFDYSFSIPAPATYAPRRYYFLFTRNDTVYTVPERAPETYFEIGDATPPRITHAEIGRFPLQAWPAEVVAVVSDNAAVEPDSVYVTYEVVPAGAALKIPEAGRFALEPRDDSTFAGIFPFTQGEEGTIRYRIHASDVNGNHATLPPDDAYFAAALYSVEYALRYGSEEGEGPTNPFSGGAGESYRIYFDLPERQEVRVRIYDVAGRLVRDVWDAKVDPGARLSVDWDGKDAGGRRADSGVYFLRFEAGPFAATRKVVILR